MAHVAVFCAVVTLDCVVRKNVLFGYVCTGSRPQGGDLHVHDATFTFEPAPRLAVLRRRQC